MAESDLVIVVGTEMGTIDTYLPAPWPLPAHSIQIDIDGGQNGRNATAGLSLVGDAAATISALLAELVEV